MPRQTKNWRWEFSEADATEIVRLVGPHLSQVVLLRIATKGIVFVLDRPGKIGVSFIRRVLYWRWLGATQGGLRIRMVAALPLKQGRTLLAPHHSDLRTWTNTLDEDEIKIVLVRTNSLRFLTLRCPNPVTEEVRVGSIESMSPNSFQELPLAQEDRRLMGGGTGSGWVADVPFVELLEAATRASVDALRRNLLETSRITGSGRVIEP